MQGDNLRNRSPPAGNGSERALIFRLSAFGKIEAGQPAPREVQPLSVGASRRLAGARDSSSRARGQRSEGADLRRTTKGHARLDSGEIINLLVN